MEQSTRGPSLTRRASLLGAFGATLALAAGSGPAAATAARTRSGIYLLGDSWAAGLHADPAKALGQVAASILGTTIDVDAVSGTGYVDTDDTQNYLDRARAASGSARLVVVQGGSNDRSQSDADITANASATYAALRRAFPTAELLALGPGPDPEPVTDRQRALDATLEAAARASGVEYVSMLKTHWIPEGQSDAVIDPSTAHPTVEGQAYLGTRLAATIRLHHPSMFA